MARLKGERYGQYKKNYDESGRTEKENRLLRSFWIRHKVIDMITLTPEEQEQVIDNFLEKWKQEHVSKNPSWWFPSIDRISHARYSKDWRENNKKLLTFGDK